MSVAAAHMIALEHVTKQFAGKRRVTALDDVSVEIPRGEMVAIIGPSGSGKSTLLNLVGGLDRPTDGNVRVDGEALAGLSDDDLTRVRRDKIGFIFQFFNLLPTLTSLENVGLPLHLRGWPRRKVEDRARELLTLVQLEAPWTTSPTSCRAANVSVSRLRAHWRSTRRSFSPTNRPATSTRARARRSSRSSAIFTAA
jgi:putative ABC transport system ATP-binding protein